MIRGMSSVPKRGRGRPRRAGADEAILIAASEILRTIGFRKFTVDAVSERTRIAKTTIYRRWPSKGALVAAALAPLAEPAEGDDIARGTAELLRALGEPDGEIIDVLRALLAPRLHALGDDEGAHRTIGTLLSRYLLEG
jgi:AcrR family transcriptional regulator